MKSFLLWTAFLVFGFSPRVWAAITLNGFNNNSFSRAEGKLFQDVTATTNTIFGGFSGVCEAPLSNTSVCNSCDSASSQFGCNTRRIHDDLLFEVSFTSTEVGRIMVTNDIDSGVGGGQTALVYSGYSTGVDLPANTPVTIGIRWSEICTKLFNLGSCSETETLGTSNTVRIRIGVDSNRDNLLNTGEFSTEIQMAMAKLTANTNALCTEASSSPTGACNFIAYPGDQKVFIENVRTDCSFPSLSNSSARAQAIRVYYQKANLGSPDKSTPTSTDLLISQSAANCTNGINQISLTQNEITGLTNGTDYRFAIGIVDQANNVGMVTVHDDTLDATDASECFNSTDWQNNCHLARPDEVLGLIEDEFDCFITTAAYGSALSPEVETFRIFRNRYLKTHQVGRWMIAQYYLWSPPAAQWIAAHDLRRAGARILLWPLWATATLSIHAPWLFLSLIVLFGLFFYRVLARRTR